MSQLQFLSFQSPFLSKKEKDKAKQDRKWWKECHKRSQKHSCWLPDKKNSCCRGSTQVWWPTSPDGRSQPCWVFLWEGFSSHSLLVLNQLEDFTFADLKMHFDHVRNIWRCTIWCGRRRWTTLWWLSEIGLLKERLFFTRYRFFFIDPTPKLGCLALGYPSDQQHCTIAHISIAPPLFFCIMAGTMGSMGGV